MFAAVSARTTDPGNTARALRVNLGSLVAYILQHRIGAHITRPG